MTNKLRTVFYIGVTSVLYWRVLEHRNSEGSEFTKKYKCQFIVYYEFFENIEEAIDREKKLKKWNRAWKIDLIKKKNPLMLDLLDEIKEMY